MSAKNTSQRWVCCATVRPMETAFVDDTILQDALALKAQIALDACTTWARKSGMRWKLGMPFATLQPWVYPSAGGFQLEGEKIQVVSKVKYLGMVLDANGATAESLRGRVRPATGRLMERRGTATRHAANRGGTFLRYIRIVNVATQRVSETDITCRYDDDQRI
jgi:hypothetical protein